MFLKPVLNRYKGCYYDSIAGMNGDGETGSRQRNGMESNPPQMNHSRRALLVFNCHEAWVYQLSALDYDLDIVVGLRGRYKRCWDDQIRPVPPNARLITLTEARRSQREYDCIITHNISDLLDIKDRSEPRITVLHLPIEARMLEEQSTVSARELADGLLQYLRIVGGHAVAVTEMKSRSWGVTSDVVHCWADPADYRPWRGNLAKGLRISNFIHTRRQFLYWDFHERAFADLPVQIVGHNPQMIGVEASRSWDHLKELLASHRFYIHTADPSLEDGFNMAMVEAMAAGMPILGNRHPTSPIEHGVSGFLSDDPTELHWYAQTLLANRELAAEMGCRAQAIAREKFGKERFCQAFMRSIARAQKKCKTRRSEPEAISST